MALDMKAISMAAGGAPRVMQRSGMPQLGSSKRAADALWERMKQCMEELHREVTTAWQLQTAHKEVCARSY